MWPSSQPARRASTPQCAYSPAAVSSGCALKVRGRLVPRARDIGGELVLFRIVAEHDRQAEVGLPIAEHRAEVEVQDIVVGERVIRRVRGVRQERVAAGAHDPLVPVRVDVEHFFREREHVVRESALGLAGHDQLAPHALGEQLARSRFGGEQLLRSRHEHELALDLAPLEALERLAGALERQRRVDRGAQLALGDPREQLLAVRAVLRGLAHRERAPEHADDLAALEQHEVERNLRDVAGGEADDEVAALPGDAAQRRLGERAADRIVDDVDAVAAGERLDALLEILVRVVDALVGAVLAAERELVGRSTRRRSRARRAACRARPRRCRRRRRRRARAASRRLRAPRDRRARDTSSRRSAASRRRSRTAPRRAASRVAISGTTTCSANAP